MTSVPRRTLAHVPKLLRRLNRPGFMRHGRPDDSGEPELRKYMLDTNVCVCLIEESSPETLRRVEECLEGEIVMSAATLAELHYGTFVIGDSRKRKSRDRAVEKLRERIPALPFDEDAALAYARVRAADPKRNIRAMDKLIAAHAVALGLVLVTNNPKDFRKFRPALRVENWAAGNSGR